MQTKQCSTCKEDKPLSDFHRNSSKQDGYQYSCKTCMKVYHKSWYTTNAATHKVNVKKNVYKFKQRFYEFMQTQSCVDCGESRVATLQWDHIDPSLKEFNISDGLRMGYGWDRLMAEISKCVCRCSNCHAVKTGNQFGWYQYEDRLNSLDGN